MSNYSNSSDAAKSGLSLELIPIDRFVINGFQSRCSNVFECTTAYISTSNEGQWLNRLFGGTPTTPAPVTYPYMLLRINSLAQNTTNPPANAKHMLRHGIPTVRTGQAGDESSQTRMFSMYPMPTTFSIGFKFVTNSFAQGFEFARRCLIYSTKGGVLDFNIQYGSNAFSVKVRNVENISVPQGQTASGAASAADEHIYEGTFEVDGWLSLTSLVERQVVHTIDASIDAITSSELSWKTDYPDGPEPETTAELNQELGYAYPDLIPGVDTENLYTIRGKTHNPIKPADQTKVNSR